MDNVKGKRKWKYRRQEDVQCWCWVCDGRSRDHRTAKEHNARPRSHNLHVMVDAPSPELMPPAVDDDVMNAITPQMQDLLVAYDQYFLETFVEAEAPLYPRPEAKEGDAHDEDAQPTVAMLVVMHLDWMSTFKNSGARNTHVQLDVGCPLAVSCIHTQCMHNICTIHAQWFVQCMHNVCTMYTQ